MNTNNLNTALYEKIAAEQDKYRDWLKSQPPAEVLNHAYAVSYTHLYRPDPEGTLSHRTGAGGVRQNPGRKGPGRVGTGTGGRGPD